VLTAGLIRVDPQLHRLAVLDPRRHLFRNLGDHFQRIDPNDGHHRHLRLDQLAEVHQPFLDVAVERRADLGVAQLTIGELHARFRRLDAGAQVLRILQREVVARLLRLQRRRRVVERLLRDERAFEQLARAIVRLPGLGEIGGGLLHVGRLLGLRQMLRVWRAELRERFLERRALLIEVVLLLFPIDEDQGLPRFHAIAEIGEDAAHLAVGLGGNGHLIDGRQRPHQIDGPLDRLFLDGLERDRLGRGVAPAGLRTFRLRAAEGGHRGGDDGGG